MVRNIYKYDINCELAKALTRHDSLSIGRMAPELLRGESGNTGASDVYSFGIILYEIYSRKDPYEGEKDEDVIRQVCDPAVAKRPSVPPLMPPAMESMMRECLVAEASVRPTFHEIDSRLKRLDAVSVDSGYRHGHPWGSSVGQPVKQEHDEAAAARNATLLLEVFPPHIAAALRDGRKVEPEQHDCVTILFADVVGFTSISGAMSPLKVADMLDRLYTTIDRLSEQHACFKLEVRRRCFLLRGRNCWMRLPQTCFILTRPILFSFLTKNRRLAIAGWGLQISAATSPTTPPSWPPSRWIAWTRRARR